jgi:glutamate synthase (NADPH/NADH) small chain
MSGVRRARTGPAPLPPTPPTGPVRDATGLLPHDARLEERFPAGSPLYTSGEALAEANRCLYCADAPCIQACPTGIDVPAFIGKIATGNLRGSARTILAANVLGASCARVCPVEVLCAGACVYVAWGRPPIEIGRLQRYATEPLLRGGATHFTKKPATGRRVALVGAGPASIAAAALLELEGHHAVLFERGTLPGGLNATGIAPYKFRLEDALAEVAWLRDQLGFEVRTGVEVGADLAPARLLADFDAVFLGLGLGADARLRIPGEDGPGVLGATALIARVKTEPAFRLAGVRRAAVIGGGNTAIDAAHALALLGLEDVALVYRRSRAELPGYAHELAHARQDGVRLVEDRVALAVLRDREGAVRGLALGQAESGRPMALDQLREEHACDLVVVAIGRTAATRLATGFPGVELDARGRIVVDPATHRTGNPRVWSAGDCVNGGREVVHAVAEAKIAARHMDAFLRG